MIHIRRIGEHTNAAINEGRKPKMEKVYRITQTHEPLWGGNTRTYTMEGSLRELIDGYSYTLEVGQSWEHERGNKKINMNPKTIQALCDNLYKAKNNAARNGYSGDSFDWELIGEREAMATPNDTNENSKYNRPRRDINERLSLRLEEYRIYALEERTAKRLMQMLKCNNVESIPDNSFIDSAERNGDVWSLEGFQDTWNNNSQMMPSPEFSYIRIFNANGTPVDIGDKKYRVYAINNDTAFDDEYSHFDDIPNDVFTSQAEDEGTVWTLAGFQDTWNNDAQMCPDPEYSWIRILPR